MQKSLIAVAVGGALAVIGAAPALAQNATVNVYGTFYGEFASISNGAKTGTNDQFQRYDHFQNPGSEIGFRGEEKLGGGLSAWFQCNSSIDYRGSGNSASNNSQAGSTWCTRNSALGMKGGFGNIFYGNWQTPYTRISNAGNVGSNDTGVFGNAHIMTGTSTTTGISSPTAGSGGVVAAGATTLGGQINNLQPGVFRRRQNNLATYETPNFSGFTGMGSVTTRNYASAATSAQLKTRLWSLGGMYNNGPLFIGAAYEKHKDMYQVAANIGGGESAWQLAGSYKFSNNLTLGGAYNDIKSTVALGSDVTIKTWHIGIDWMISGPHGVRAAYSRAGDTKGLVGAVMPTRPAVNEGGATSADMWQIRYVHMLSKRTELNVGYSRTNNRANGTYETGGAISTQFPGADSNAIAASMKHSF